MGAPPDPARRLLFAELRSRLGLLLPALGLLCLWQACEASVPILIGMVVDHAIVPLSWPRIIVGLGAVAALFAVLSLGYRFGARLANVALNRSTHELRVRVAAHALNPRGVRTTLLPGETLALATSDADRAGAVFRHLPLVAASLVGVILGSVYLLVVDWVVGLVVLVGVAVSLAITRVATPVINRRSERQQETIATASGQAADLMQGLRVLKGIGGGTSSRRRYAAASRAARDAGIATQTGVGLIEAVQVLVLGLLVAVVVAVAGLRLLDGHLTTGELIAVVGLATFLAEPIGSVIFFAAQLALSTAGARRIAAYLATTGVIRTGIRDAVPGPTALRVRLPTGATGAAGAGGAGAELRVAADENVAVVCPDAVLADRIVRALAGENHDHDQPDDDHDRSDDDHDRPDDGQNTPGEPVEVELFDVPRHELSLPAAHAAVVVAPHQVDLFAGTVRSNVMLRPGADLDLDAVLDASATAELVGLFPDGLEHPVEPSGTNLSGGQRQRISLARALAADPPLLVLADPTTAVDAVTEQHIARSVAALRTGRATVVLTTSPAFLAAADRVVVLTEDGVRQGRHAELMATEADYRILVAR